MDTIMFYVYLAIFIIGISLNVVSILLFLSGESRTRTVSIDAVFTWGSFTGPRGGIFKKYFGVKKLFGVKNVFGVKIFWRKNFLT